MKNEIEKLKQQLSQAQSLAGCAMDQNFYLEDYTDNVFPPARTAIAQGRFRDMFMEGDGHELEDYVCNGKLYPAHARAIFSSSMLAFNFFHWVCEEHPLTLDGVEYDKVYFEVKMKVLEGRHPANMDVVLFSRDRKTTLCIESKFMEYLKAQKAVFANAYSQEENYCEGNIYKNFFVYLQDEYKNRKGGYLAGVKQNICHLIAITNLKYDANARQWFRQNNPCMETELLEVIRCTTDFRFMNLLYYPSSRLGGAFFRHLREGENAYVDLLAELESSLPLRLSMEVLPQRFTRTYSEMYLAVSEQMPAGLSPYLADRYFPEHPLDKYRSLTKGVTNATLSMITDPMERCKLVNQELTVAVHVTQRQDKVGKSNKPFGIFTVEDHDDFIDLCLLGEDYTRYQHFFEQGECLLITVQLDWLSTWKGRNKYIIKPLKIDKLQSECTKE